MKTGQLQHGLPCQQCKALFSQWWDGRLQCGFLTQLPGNSICFHLHIHVKSEFNIHVHMLNVLHILSTYWHNPDHSCLVYLSMRIWEHVQYCTAFNWLLLCMLESSASNFPNGGFRAFGRRSYEQDAILHWCRCTVWLRLSTHSSFSINPIAAQCGQMIVWKYRHNKMWPKLDCEPFWRTAAVVHLPSIFNYCAVGFGSLFLNSFVLGWHRA